MSPTTIFESKAATLANQPMEHSQASFEGEGFNLDDIARKYEADA